MYLDPDAGLTEQARRVKWAMEQEAKVAAGIMLDDATAIELVRIQSSSIYQSIKDVASDFGLDNALRMF